MQSNLHCILGLSMSAMCLSLIILIIKCTISNFRKTGYCNKRKATLVLKYYEDDDYYYYYSYYYLSFMDYFVPSLVLDNLSL